MNLRQRLIRIIGAIILFALAMMFFTSCNQKLCPAYDSAVRAKTQLKISRVDKQFSDFCRPKKKK